MKFGDEAVTIAAVGLPVKRTRGVTTDVDRAIQAGGEAKGLVSVTRPQQLGPGFGAVGAVFGQEGVTIAAVGLSIERTSGVPTHKDRAIQTGSEGIGKVIAARTQQLGPGFGAISAVFGQESVIAAAVGLPI